MLSSQHGDVCGSLANRLGRAQALWFIAILAVVAVNTLLKRVVLKLVAFERHPTSNAQAQALCLKLFYATFVNTGVVILLVQGRPPVGVERAHPAITGTLGLLGVLDGEHDDFSPGWYSSVGVSIAYTLALNLVASYVSPLS
jgi:hypothetical protein